MAKRSQKTPEQAARDREFSAFRNEWLKQVAADPNLPVSAYRVAVFLALEHLNWKSRLAWPSYATLTKELNAKGDKTAVAAVGALIDAGHLVIAVPGQKGRGKPNYYALVLKAEKPSRPGGFSGQENLPAGEGFASQENLPNRVPKTFPHGKVNTFEHISPNPQDSESGNGKATSAAQGAQPTSDEIDSLAAELLAALPPRPDTTPKPSEKLRREVAAAIASGATREALLAGAGRYRRYAAAYWQSAGPYPFAMKPETWLREGKWSAAWGLPARKARPEDQRAEADALLAEIRGFTQ
jgi:hypothetical protein